MLSLHSFFAGLMAPVVARRRTAARRMLVRFARAELGSSLTMRWAAAATPSPERRALYLLHALDEERHARLFLARAQKLGAVVAPLLADAEDLLRSLGERRFVAFVHRAEARGEREFEAYRRSFWAAGDRKTAAVFGVVLRDERRHVAYSRRLFEELGGTPATSLAVALWETLRTARRAARELFGVASHVVLIALYPALAPFSLFARLCLRRRPLALAARRALPEPLRLQLRDKQVEFRKPVFGAGAPKTNETCIRITSPARGSQDAPAGFRSVLSGQASVPSRQAAGAGLAGRSRWRIPARADRDLFIQDLHALSGGGRRRRPR